MFRWLPLFALLIVSGASVIFSRYLSQQIEHDRQAIVQVERQLKDWELASEAYQLDRRRQIVQRVLLETSYWGSRRPHQLSLVRVLRGLKLRSLEWDSAEPTVHFEAEAGAFERLRKVTGVKRVTPNPLTVEWVAL